MIQKQVIFNVGGALASYLEFDENKIVVDLGKVDYFNPVVDFLFPLAQKRNFDRDPKDNTKYSITQSYISHLDNDHISLIQEFDKYFTPELLTVPCYHPRQDNLFNIIKNFFTGESENRDKILQLMEKRSPGYGREIQEDYDKPLVVHKNCINNIKLFYIPANECGNEEIFEKKDYSNNTSLVLFIEINGNKIFMPGDLMKKGMEYLINKESELAQCLQNLGIDFLIAPHHGLSTSFPDVLFNTIKENKTNRLNIVSEKLRKSILGERRSDVDSRYYGKEFCNCNNNFDGQGGIKTSGGHIVIDYSQVDPVVKIIETDKKDDLIKEFIE